jgi:hypothetical protein
MEETSDESDAEVPIAPEPADEHPSELRPSMDFEFNIEIPGRSEITRASPIQGASLPIGRHGIALSFSAEQQKRQVSAFFTCFARITSIDLNITLDGKFARCRAFSHFATATELHQKITLRPALFSLDDLPQTAVPARVVFHKIPDVKVSRTYFGCRTRCRFPSLRIVALTIHHSVRSRHWLFILEVGILIVCFL